MSNRPSLIIGGFGAFLVGAALVLLARDAGATEWGLGLDELSVDYRNQGVLGDSQRNLLIYPESPKEAINVNIKTDLLGVFGWDSTIETLTTSAQYRGIGLQTALYARLSQSLDVGYWHHSQHVIDRSSATLPRYPSEDALTVKLYLFRAHPGRESLF